MGNAETIRGLNEFNNVALKSVPLPPSYTLAEIEQLARTYTTEAANRTTDELVLSLFLAWLAKREQEERRNVD